MSTLRALTFAVGAPAFAASGVCTATGGDACVAADDEAALMQRSFMNMRRSSEPKSALCLEGGGWLAYSSHSSILIGLAAATLPESSPATDIMKGFDAVGGTSGGSWLTASMMFSQDYDERMTNLKAAAQDKAKIQELWKGWVENGYKTVPRCGPSETADYLEKLAEKRISFGSAANSSRVTSLYDAAKVRRDFVASGGQGPGTFSGMPWEAACTVYTKDWQDTVPKMLEGMGVPSDATFGTKPQPWANGKVMFFTATIPARDNATADLSPKTKHNYLQWDQDEQGRVEYNPLAKKLVQYVPAKFAYTLGRSSESQPSRSFCADEDCFGVRYRYTTDGESKTVDMGEIFKESFVEHSDQVPLGKASAASSAFDGADEIAHMGGFADVVLGDGAVFAAKGSDGDSFKNGEQVKDHLDDGSGEEGVQRAAKAGLFALIDGAFSDNTGIGAAVGSGAEHVVSLQTASYNGLPGSVSMFARGGMMGTGEIFAGVNEMDILQDFLSSPYRTQGPEGANLREVIFTSRDLVTVENKAFGIKAGRNVKLTMVWTRLKGMGIGPPSNDFNDYGSFMADTINAVATNKTFAAALAEHFPAL